MSAEQRQRLRARKGEEHNPPPDGVEENEGGTPPSIAPSPLPAPAPDVHRSGPLLNGGVRILRSNLLLLGARRRFGDVLTAQEAERIPGHVLASLIDIGDVELLSPEKPDLERRVAVLEAKMAQYLGE